MIIVIADDFTGAAELGGIGLRYGLRVALSNKIAGAESLDLLVVYTNTRSMNEADAVQVMHTLTAKAKELNPSLFYKKTDSVLRGHVLVEIRAQMQVLGLTKALLVPANPLLGRTISRGHYFLNGQPIHETGFSTDPEFPISSSFIPDMLGDQTVNLTTVGEDLAEGISIGEAETMENITKWAAYQDQPILFAGAASFFNALLEFKHKATKEKRKINLADPILLVSGTTFQSSIERRKDYAHLVSDMPATLFLGTHKDEIALEGWAEETVNMLLKYGKAIIAIGEPGTTKADSNYLRETLSDVVHRILQRASVHELLIEGGSTAYTIIDKLRLSCFIPTEEIEQGVVRMKVEGKADMHLTIKPGSYGWPEEWNFN